MFNDKVSHTILADSGVFHGSNLGLLLFLIFVNDLPSRITSECLMYADNLTFESLKTQDI